MAYSFVGVAHRPVPRLHSFFQQTGSPSSTKHRIEEKHQAGSEHRARNQRAEQPPSQKISLACHGFLLFQAI
jgi:hypothetical protein